MYQLSAATNCLSFTKSLTHQQVPVLEKQERKLILELKQLEKKILTFDFSACDVIDTAGFAYIVSILRLMQQDSLLKEFTINFIHDEKLKVYSQLYDLEDFFTNLPK